MVSNEDIVLITIDCWRHDALPQMDRTSKLASQWNSGSCITASPHTPGAFPAIFASTYFPDLYVENRKIPSDTMSLPRILSDEGYATGGFIGSNTMLDAWSDHFDEFWNDGFRANGVDQSRRKSSDSTASKLIEHIKLSPKVTARDAFTRAEDWWNQQSSPRFLWVHLMEPHIPFLPGIKRGLRVGPLRTYLSLFLRSKHSDNVNHNGEFPDWAIRHLKALHYECAKKIDSQIVNFINSVGTNNKIIITGDHGEEYDHGLLTHARLYDETIRVPFITNTDVLPNSGYIRQQDIAPSILDSLDIQWPDQWEGKPAVSPMPIQKMIGSLNRYDKPFWLGVRSEQWKIIQRYSINAGFSDPEVYHLEDDPRELNNLKYSEASTELKKEIEEFREQSDIDNIIEGFVGDPEPDMEDRLRHLGYIE